MFLTFTNTVLLIGFAGVVVPVVLHLLSRARYHAVDWGAMLFLEQMEGRPQHTGRMNQVLLMVVRMTVVALLAFALAQPVLQQWAPQTDARGAALRAADHGRLLCLAGVLASAVLLSIFLVAALSRFKSRGVRLRPLMYLVASMAAGAGLVASGRRAAAWDVELTKLISTQPAGSSDLAGGDPARPRIDAAVLLDCSPSMDFEENGHTRFSAAQAAAKQVLAGLHRADRVSLVLMGRRQIDAELEPTTDLQSVADRIDAARTGRDPADLAQALRRAEGALDRGGRAARDLYIICDRQGLSWRGVTDYFTSSEWPDRIRQSGSATRLFAVPIGNSDAENVAVERIELANPPAILGQPTEVLVDIHNYGSTPRAALPLAVAINGRTVFESTVSVAASRIARVSIPLKGNAITTAGTQVVTAEVKSAGYRDDDRLESIVEAIEPIRVLVISGDEWDEKPGEFRSESDFLRLALAPLQAMHRGGADPCKVDVIPEEQWPQIVLQRYQVVVLANIERFTAAEARAIEQYVYGGGGLLVAPGGLTRIENYNDQLWRDGSGILPAELEYPTSADGSEATTIVGYDPSSPVFQFLHDRPDLMLTPTIGRYFPTNPRPSDAQPLAWYTSGPPFLIESHSGRGKVLLMTTSLDADWTTLPLSNFYLPYLQSAVRYLAAGTLPVRNVAVGEPIRATFDESIDDGASMELPSDERRPVSIVRFADVSELRFSDTREPGIYRLHLKDHTGERTLAFAVHASTDESDLTQLTAARWADLESALHMKRIDPNEQAVATTVASVREGYELWPWAIAAVLLLAIAELGLARYWSRDAY